MAVTTTVRAVSFRGVVIAIGIALGVSFVLDRQVGASLAFVVGFTMLVVVRGGLVPWDVFLAGLGGAMILGLGFANVGVWVGSVPVPFSALLLGLLVAIAVFSRPVGLWSFPTILILSLVTVTALHLVFDYPRYGVLALRDATLPVETSWTLVGYWTVRRYGPEQWVRAMPWIFLTLLVYLTLRPWYGVLEDYGPVVGLQRPVPLFGDLSASGFAAASAVLFFALVRPFGMFSYLVGAAFLPFVLLAQLRGLYLAIPAAFLLTWLLVGRRGRRQVVRGLAASIAIGCLAAALIFPFAPRGRLAPVTADFLASQLATLAGERGPGAGTIDQRLEWLDDVTDQVADRRLGWLTGLGLGPDLVGGFRTSLDAPLVRKPHNDYLEIFARLGLPGLVLLVSILGFLIAHVVRAVRRVSEAEARFLSWILGTSIVYVTIAATQPILAYPYGTIPLFASLGAGLAVAHRSREDPGAHPR